MCGITGILNSDFKGPVDPGILRRMNSALTHRGPDDEGYWLGDRAGLAMRRLSIIDLEGGHQPVTNETQDVWTVFNGEIYNFRELRHELKQKGHRFQTQSDTEVIVHLYEEEGESFVQKLRGMFAIALWDDRNRVLLLYRDRVGIKPLHYSWQGGTLIFASEIKALLEHPECDRDFSPEALNDYLSLLYVPSPRTLYQGIRKLPAGHRLRWENGDIGIQSYWDFQYPENQNLTESQWTEKLRAQLQDSVASHLVSDVPVGAFLSGGMDSSSVVGCMSRAQRERVKTYSIGFRDKAFNELPYAARAARHFGTDHHERIVEANALQLLPKIIRGFDEPFADSSAIPTYLVSEFARRDVKVALSGDGGDELFAGYLWTRKESWLETYRRIPGFLRKTFEKFILGDPYEPLRETGAWSALQRFLYDAGLPPWQGFARRASCFQPWMKEKLLKPSVRETLRQSTPEMFRSYFEKGSGFSLMNRLLYLDSKIYLPDDLLTKVDRMSMLHSLEVRVPLLDHRLIELAGSIPFSLKLKGRTTKHIFRQAMKDLLPPALLKQRKHGFAVPLGRWFREDLAGFAKNLLLDPEAESAHYFDQIYVEWLLDQHQRGAQRFGAQIYTLVVFEMWARQELGQKVRTA